MTPEHAAEMYERLVSQVLDAENVVNHGERIGIMREILKAHNAELAVLVDRAGHTSECSAECHRAMKNRVESLI